MPSNKFSRLGSTFRQGAQRSISDKKEQLKGLLEHRINQAKLLIDLPSITDLHGFVQPSTLAAAQTEFNLASQRKNLSFVGALSRAISLPSVSGPSLQACGYHIDHLISEPAQISLPVRSKEVSMAVYCSRTSIADRSFSNLTSFRIQPALSTNGSSTSYTSRSSENCRKASMSLKNKEQPNNFVTYGYFIFDVAKRRGIFGSCPEFGLKGFHTSSSACNSADTAPDMSYDNSLRDIQISDSADSVTEYAYSFSFSVYLFSEPPPSPIS